MTQRVVNVCKILPSQATKFIFRKSTLYVRSLSNRSSLWLHVDRVKNRTHSVTGLVRALKELWFILDVVDNSRFVDI